MRIDTRVISAIIVTLGLLTAGCMGDEESPFYGEEIKPEVYFELAEMLNKSIS